MKIFTKEIYEYKNQLNANDMKEYDMYNISKVREDIH